MHKSRQLLLIMVAVAGLLLLAACGGDSGGGNGGDTTNGGTSGGASELAISVSEQNPLEFDKKTLSAQSGQEVTINFSVPGSSTLPHSFVIEEGAQVAIPAQPDQGLSPGQSGSATFTAPAAGTYEYYCAVPGHRESGMVGTLEVTE